MVVLNKIFTKTGDQGQTSLGGGTRVSKSSFRVDSYGNVDELNSFIGFASNISSFSEKYCWLRDPLLMIQNDLFDLGADLCRPGKESKDGEGRPVIRISQELVLRLEKEIDDMNDKLQPLNSFILPGGGQLACAFHVCRSVSRRAERSLVSLMESEIDMVNPMALQYLNRLSDWFFVAARLASMDNEDGAGEVLWQPNRNA